MNTFILTEDHLKLLRRAYVSWEDCEYGAPSIDCKRPYGNSFVEGDIAEILGWPVSDELTEEQYDRAALIHSETQTALQIVLASLSNELTGSYEQKDRYYLSHNWSRVR